MYNDIHGKTVSFAQMDNHIPDRKLFIDKKESKPINDLIVQEKNLLFMPTFLIETHMQDVKYEKAVYKIVLIGIFQDGRRVNVILDNIKLYFDIQLTDESKEKRQEQHTKILDLLGSDEATMPTDDCIINAKPFKYYQEKNSKFLRLFYEKTKTRKTAIVKIRKHGYITASDDLASYYRVVCRNHLCTFSTWSVLSNYQEEYSNELLKGTTFRLDINDYKAYTGELTGNLLKDKTLSCGWDIETYSKDGDVPMPENMDDKIFCISMTFQWVHEAEPFYKVCLCDLPSTPKEGYLTIVCGNEKNIILGFSKVFERMRPDFIFGFNDSDYDWNWVIKRAATYNGLLSKIATNMDSTRPWLPYTDKSVMDYSFKSHLVKVEASTYIDGHALMVNGYLPVDVRTVFRKLYPTAEKSSLAWFLSMNKLGGKEDMPYQEMFRIYKEFSKFLNIKQHEPSVQDLLNGKVANVDTSNWLSDDICKYTELKEKMADINYYCIIDSQRCHDLVKIRNIITDHREVANLSYTSVYDAFFRANGMKVRNMAIAIGQTPIFNILFSNISNNDSEEGKYVGGFVLTPDKGMQISKLTMEERIRKADLLKDKISSNNDVSCQEWLGTTPEELECFHSFIKENGAYGTIDKLQELESKLNTKFPKKFKDFWVESIGRPITGLDFSSLYPSLIRAYNLSPECCILNKKHARQVAATGQQLTKVDFLFQGQRKLAYFVWHNTQYSPTNEDGSPNKDFQFGVYPYILDDLFKKRAAIKKKMKVFDHRKEIIEAMSDKEQEEVAEEYEEVVFNRNYLNSKQSALKVFMNTFYGEAGNRKSSFFVLEVAGGITTWGKTNIMNAYALVKENGCNVYYGDSVADTTPIYVKFSMGDRTTMGDNYIMKDSTNIGMHLVNTCMHLPISQLAGDSAFVQYNNNKQIATVDNLMLIYVWSDKGWTRIRHVIRHVAGKRMYRVVTDQGSVEVTEDHSLLDLLGNPIKPTEIIIGQTRLMSSYKPTNEHAYAIKSPNSIVTSIEEIPYEKNRYVYDLETDSHHFSAGIGNLVVHNTDSLYLSTPEKSFVRDDIEFYSGKIDKLDYWTRLVETTFKEINPIKDLVNKFFIKDNGTHFLSMAYEEVLYPVAFTTKKKYFGIAHENIPNFKPKDLFIRGIEAKKRGASELLKTNFMELMWTTCSPDNLYSLIELVFDKIDYIYSEKWDADSFVMSGVYRPNRKNIALNTLVRRMQERGIEIKPNERFLYVVVKKYPYKYNLRGCVDNILTGDKYELIEEFNKGGMEIDLDHYMRKSINNQLARLITYHEMFKVEPVDSSDEEIKLADEHIYKNACKYIDQYCKKYYDTYNVFGKTHQKVFRTANGLLTNHIKLRDPLVSELISANVDYKDFEKWFLNYVDKRADKAVKNYGKDFILNELQKYSNLVIENANEDISKEELKEELKKRRREQLRLLQKGWYNNSKNSILEIREQNYKNTMIHLKHRLQQNHEKIMKIYKGFNNSTEQIISIIQKRLNITDEYYKPTADARNYAIDDFDDNVVVIDDALNYQAEDQISKLFEDKMFISAISDFKNLYIDIMSAYVTIKGTYTVVDYLKDQRDTLAHVIPPPSKIKMAKIMQINTGEITESLADIDI